MREDWIECDLDKVCVYSKGKKPPVLSNALSENINVPYINIKAFEKGIIDEYTNGDKCNLCKDGDLLMVWDGARAGLSGKAKKGAVGSTLMKIEEVKGIEKEYLYYFLQSLFTKINTNPRGVGIPHVEPRILWLSKILIVSSPIQRAIVSKIETLFSDLENGIANFKKAQEQLKIYRQAVLKKAFEGELTKEWREKQTNLPKAEELLRQIKEERQNHYNQQLEDWKKAVKEWEKNGKVEDKPRKPSLANELPPLKKEELDELPNLPNGWAWCKNLNVSTKITDGEHITPKREESGYYLLSARNIQNGYISYSNIDYVGENEYLRIRKRCNPEFGDILISCSGSVGRISLVPQKSNFVMVRSVALVKTNVKIYNPKFLEYLFLSPELQSQIEDGKKATAQANLFLEPIGKLNVIICSLQEQAQIVQEIESRLSVCDKMEQSINESIKKAEALRQSILKKAFEGKLLSQAEIVQCKQAPDYEPASVLLKKIQTEKLAKEQEKNKPIIKKKSKK